MDGSAVWGRRRVVALLAAALLVAGGCGSDGDSVEAVAEEREVHEVDPGSAGGSSDTSVPSTAAEVAGDPDGPELPGNGGDAAPFREREPGCLDTVTTAREQDDPTGDGAELVRRSLAGELPMRPAFDDRTPVLGDVERFDDVAAYFGTYSAVIEADERRHAMEELGFAGAVDVDLLFGLEVVSIMTLRFESPEDASAYADLHLRRACQDAVGMRGMASVSGGVAYVREGRTPVTKAVFVVGDTEVNLTLCHCVSVDDVIAETEAWAERVAASPSPKA